MVIVALTVVLLTLSIINVGFVSMPSPRASKTCPNGSPPDAKGQCPVGSAPGSGSGGGPGSPPTCPNGSPPDAKGQCPVGTGSTSSPQASKSSNISNLPTNGAYNSNKQQAGEQGGDGGGSDIKGSSDKTNSEGGGNREKL